MDQRIRALKGMVLASYYVVPGTHTMPPDEVWRVYKSGQATMEQIFLSDGTVKVTFLHSGQPPIPEDRCGFRWSREGNVFRGWVVDTSL